MSHRAAAAALRFRTTLPAVGGTAAPRAGRGAIAIATSRRDIIVAQRGAASSYDYSSSSSSSIPSLHLTTAARTTVDEDDVDRSSNDHGDGDNAVHLPNTGRHLYFQRRSPHHRPSHHPRHHRHHHQRRSFASGSSGFVPGGRGMGRDGGGRGSGRASAAGRNGPSHQPGRDGAGGAGGAGGGGAGGGGAGGRGAGAFERFRAKREAAQREQREREAAAAASGGGGGGTAAGSEEYKTPTATATKKKFHRGGDKKTNVARTFLEPASRGELVGKHDSGIPKLLAKKKKSLTVHDDFPDEEAATLLREEQQRAVDALDEEEYAVGGEGYGDDEAVARASKGGGGGGARSILTELRERRRESVIGKYAQPTRGMQPLEHREYDSVFADEDYVSDDEYDDDLNDEPLPKYEDHPDVVQRPDGRYELRDGAWADEDDDDDDSDDEVDPLDDGTPAYARAKAESRKIYSNDPRSMVPIPGIGGDNVRDPDTDEVMQTNPDEDFFYPDIMNFTMKFSDAPLPYANQLRPLENEYGDGLDNFLQANLEHPTKYAEVRRTNLHPDSRREAKPIVPKNRAEPPREWVERYKGYLYVTHLVHPVFGEDGVVNPGEGEGAEATSNSAELGEYDNPLHRHEVAVTAANLFDVEVTDVYPTNMTSAFVGFKTQRDAKIAWKTKNLDERVQEITVVMTKLSDGNNDNDEEAIVPELVKEFVQSAEGGAASIVQLTNVPPGMAPGTLVRSLFPPQSDLEKVLGPIDPKADVAFRSPTAALLKFANADRATLAVHYTGLQERLDTLTTRRVRIFRAMRERIHDTFAGPNRWAQVKKRGSRLIVDGDLPPHEFYVSHTSVMHLRNVPDDVTKHDLAALVQPYCVEHRDVAGSAHVVTCADGLPTGRVFVGFDRDGEAEAFFKAHSIDPNRGGRWNVNGHVVMVKPVKDKGLRRGNRSEERSSRQVSELLDDLNSWEKHVDPDDVEELERLGVSREVLGEALTALRYHNRSFGSVDQAAKGERLRPERLAGTHYRDMCRLYVSVLKECSSTPENPGLMYEAMFQPGEEVETESVFEYERERIEELRKKHG